MAKALRGEGGVREGKEAGEIGARGGGLTSVGGSLALSNSLQALMRARMTDDYTSQVCAPATATTSANPLMSQPAINLKISSTRSVNTTSI